ncbi:hypothetical protein [Brucella pseudogrignonensis]|uniref:hypothetical protein n=1 Tax=Brucella pseudogrignonensis TaxID=419475 RepID=UPI001F29B182|nr:hypothetical protein [Brucella pseudogrignonensis]
MMISASLIQFDVVPLAAERNIERMCTFIETEAAQGPSWWFFRSFPILAMSSR